MSETPLTDLREKHQRDYRTYYDRHPEQTLKDQDRQQRYQDESRESADRHGDEWTEADEAEAMTLGASLGATAQNLGRTYAAVRQGRFRRVRYYDLSNSLVKSEHDEYMALVRRKDFTLEDVERHKQKWRDRNRTRRSGGVQ